MHALLGAKLIRPDQVDDPEAIEDLVEEAEVLRARGARRAARLLPAAVPARPEKTRRKKKRKRA
mgnify:CR=1 FL=1